jgi:uncharacterized surface protein with fasciclin (FAS1) repeats
MKLTIAWVLSLMVLMTACGENGNGTENTGDSNSTEEQLDSTQAREKVLEERKIAIAENEKKKQEVDQKQREDNPLDVTSVYTYMRTSLDYQYMAKLIFKSSYKKTLHNETVTFLACDDATLEANYDLETVMLLTIPENKAKLDKFIAGHIIESRISSFKLQKSIEEITTIDGKKLEFSKVGAALTINGIRAEQHDYQANNGIIIKMKDVINFPLKK